LVYAAADHHVAAQKESHQFTLLFRHDDFGQRSFSFSRWIASNKSGAIDMTCSRKRDCFGTSTLSEM
jgi:hypothetical protein